MYKVSLQYNKFKLTLYAQEQVYPIEPIHTVCTGTPVPK